MGVTPSDEMGSYVANRPSKLTGGSLDCPDLGKGASIYFPVHVPGAMFLAGGGKATGANGKVNYFGMEVPLTAYLQFIVHKGKPARRSTRRECDPFHHFRHGRHARCRDAPFQPGTGGLPEGEGGARLLLRVLARFACHRFQHTRANTTGQLMHTTIPKYIFVNEQTKYWYSGELAPKYYLPGNYFSPDKAGLIQMASEEPRKQRQHRTRGPPWNAKKTRLAVALAAARARRTGQASDEVKYDYYVPSKWNTVTWGIYSAEYPPVLKVKPGAVVKIDIANPSGSNRNNPKKFFVDNNIPLDLPVVKDILEIHEKTPMHPAGCAARCSPGRCISKARSRATCSKCACTTFASGRRMA